MGWKELDWIESNANDEQPLYDNELYIDERLNNVINHSNGVVDNLNSEIADQTTNSKTLSCNTDTTRTIDIKEKPSLATSHLTSETRDEKKPNLELQSTHSHSTEKNDTTMTQASVNPLTSDNPNTQNTHSTAQALTPNEQPMTAFDGDTSRANPNFKPLLPKPIHQGESGRQLIMDTETTGLDALKGDRIVEVGIVELLNRKPTGEKLHVYINPQRGMDEEVIRIHGITEAFLADQPTFDKVAQKLYDFMLGAEVIAHNASFDMNFLSMEFDKVGLTDFSERVQVTDSLAMAKQQYPGQKNTLDALVRRLNVGKADRTFHGALLDAEILAEVYLAMTGGQVSLAIDDDNKTVGVNTHSDFSHLADKLLSVPSYTKDHLQWVANQIAKYPNILTTQGLNCFYEVTENKNAKQPIYRVPFIKDSPLISPPNKTLFIGKLITDTAE